jgi:hypothetical protein
MAPVSLLAPPPSLGAHDDVPATPSAIFGIRVDSAVNLLEARDYHGLSRDGRLTKALTEQRAFLNQLLDPSLGVVDLRTRVTPGAPSPLEVGLLGRVWGAEAGAQERRAQARQDQLLAAMPKHVAASPISDAGELMSWLEPLGPATETQAAMITRRELIGIPQRPDAKVAYYFSVVPFNWADSDWSSLYSTLSQSPDPVALSVALMPLKLSEPQMGLLARYATFYARMAKEDRLTGGLYHGERMLPPDSFAVDAQPAFEDYARRYSGTAFAVRIQISSRGPLPEGLVEAIGATISPGEATATHLAGQRAASTYEIRRATTDYERDLAKWNLAALDIGLFDGAPAIWERADPPPSALAPLCVLGDARDASCAFRFPIAVDGTVPGFQVRRGAFGHEQAYTPTGRAVTIGQLTGRAGSVSIPLADLTKHTLIVGSTGSGKTTTVLEMLRQLWVDHSIPFLVIEPVNSDANDYRRLLAQPGFDALELCTVGDEALRPLRFNPFETPTGVLVAEHAANLLACFTAAFGLWEPLPSIYREALNLMYLDAGILASERPDGQPRLWPSAVEFLHAMRSVTSDLGYSGEVKHNIEAASLRRAEQLTAGAMASTFLTDRPNAIGALLDHPVILELKSLGAGDEQALMIALILNALTEHYQAVRGQHDGLAHVTVIEEAHRLLAKPEGSAGAEQAQAREKAAESFANTLAENRKYGEGIVIAEQIPTKLVADAVKNTNLKVMHRLTAEVDRDYVGQTMGMDEPQQRFATRLQPGEALVYSDSLSEAVHVAVQRTLIPGRPETPDPVAVPPFRGCAVCRSKCHYRGSALALVADARFVGEVRARIQDLERRDASVDDHETNWVILLDSLRSQVRRFGSLPDDGDGLSDAAYCLFQHLLATQRTHFAPSWSTAVAERLGVTHSA